RQRAGGGRHALEHLEHVVALLGLHRRGDGAERRPERRQHGVAGQLLRGPRPREPRRLAGDGAHPPRRREERAARRLLCPPRGSAWSLSRIGAAASFSGFLPPARTSSTLTAWKPKGVRTGSGEISPFFNAKRPCSNCGTISPGRTQPRSPPFGAEPGSSEASRASLAKSSPAFARRMTSVILALALSSPSLPPVSGTRASTCAACARRARSSGA